LRFPNIQGHGQGGTKARPAKKRPHPFVLGFLTLKVVGAFLLLAAAIGVIIAFIDKTL
jgi:hypothetical protein